MSARTGDWIQTYSGRCFWPLDPRPEEVEIADIAHALAMTCRYRGHCTRFYSVAEHSVLVSRHVPAEHALWGLLHDAAEAYSADIPRPLKRELAGWPDIEERILRAVCVRFGLPPEEPDCVKAADAALLSDERAALMVPCEREWGYCQPGLGVSIAGFRPRIAEKRFLAEFRRLTGGRV